MELIMNQSNRLAAGIDPWVTGKLGRDEAFVAKASPEKEILGLVSHQQDSTLYNNCFMEKK
jgi:hypothetical protein